MRITDDSFNFDFDTIKVATNDFSDANKLGQGGFGAVYKVKIHYLIGINIPICYNEVYQVVWKKN